MIKFSLELSCSCMLWQNMDQWCVSEGGSCTPRGWSWWGMLPLRCAGLSSSAGDWQPSPMIHFVHSASWWSSEERKILKWISIDVHCPKKLSTDHRQILCRLILEEAKQIRDVQRNRHKHQYLINVQQTARSSQAARGHPFYKLIPEF